MSETRYVQHISGQGEKWEVVLHDDYSWVVAVPNFTHRHFLPRSEYRLVEPPEHWEDVSNNVIVSAEMGCADMMHDGKWLGMAVRHGYRLRKVELWDNDGAGHKLNCQRPAFIVEKKESA